MRRIYLDHNATTPVLPEALAAMLPYFSEAYGNASSIHAFGQAARGAVERARAAVAALLGARPGEIVFTSGGTESDNAAIFGSLPDSLNNDGKIPHVITTTIEHPAVLHACRELERRGVAVTYVCVSRDGVVDPQDVRRALRPGTRLITVMHANNEIGTLQPVAEIGRIAAEAGVLLHTDAVQSAGKVAIDVKQLGVHLLSLSGHKFGAPKGVGALFIRKGTSLHPILHGGHNERDRRAGTDNVTGIVALGKAAECASAQLTAPGGTGSTAAVPHPVGVLRDRLEVGLLARVPGAQVNGGRASLRAAACDTGGDGEERQNQPLHQRVPNTCNILFPHVDSEALVIALDLAGLACSAGAACSSGAVDPSHVLTAIGLSFAEARASVRFSLGHTTTPEDIDRALELIPAAVARQRESSDSWRAERRSTVSFSFEHSTPANLVDVDALGETKRETF